MRATLMRAAMAAALLAAGLSPLPASAAGGTRTVDGIGWVAARGTDSVLAFVREGAHAVPRMITACQGSTVTVAEDAAAGGGAWAENVPEDPKSCSGDHPPLILHLHGLKDLLGG